MTLNITMLILTVLLTQGCAYNKQSVAIHPTVLLPAPSSLGEGKTVALKVVDERGSSNVGRRVGGYGPGEMITTEGDVAAAIRKKVVEALHRCKFTVDEFSVDAGRSMQVEIRIIEYNAGMGMWTGSSQSSAAFKVICKNNGKTYDNLYRASNEKRSMAVASAEINQVLINSAVSETLNKMFQDGKLMSFLAR